MPLTKLNPWFAIGDLIQQIERGLTQARLYFWRKGTARYLECKKHRPQG